MVVRIGRHEKTCVLFFSHAEFVSVACRKRTLQNLLYSTIEFAELYFLPPIFVSYLVVATRAYCRGGTKVIGYVALPY